MKTMGAILAAVMVAGAGWGQDDAGPVPQTEVGVDLLDVMARGIKAHFKDNYGKWALGIVGGIAVDRYAANNNELWHRRDDDKKTLPPPSNTALEDNDFADVNIVAGDHSPVTVHIDYYESQGK